MIVFELTMPGRGSWNGAWSGDGRRYIRTRPERCVPKAIVGKEYEHNFGDGWCALVSTYKVPAREAEKLRKVSVGFANYDWMIDSIIQYGEILTSNEQRRRNEVSGHTSNRR